MRLTGTRALQELYAPSNERADRLLEATPGGRRVKIAYVVTEFPLLSETFVLNQVTGLLELGHEVHVHVRMRGSVSDPALAAYQLDRRIHSWGMPWSYYLRLARAPALLLRHSAEERAVLLRAVNPLRFGAACLDLRLLYASHLFLGRSYDVIHCHFGPNGNLVAQMKELGIVRAPLVTTFHGWGMRRARKRGADIYEALRRHGDLFVAISRYSRGRLEELGFEPERIIDHPMGIDLDRFPIRPKARPFPRPHGEPIRILSVGRLVEEKAHEIGIRAVKQVVQNNPSWRIQYMVAGTGPLLGDLTRLSERLGIRDHVHFTGALDRDDVARVMADADVFLLPSRVEVLPLVLMEAQATGLPVVATAVGAVSELVEDGITGHLAPPEDPAALAERLEMVISATESERCEMGRRGRAAVEERHDIKKLNLRLEGILQSAGRGEIGAAGSEA